MLAARVSGQKPWLTVSTPSTTTGCPSVKWSRFAVRKLSTLTSAPESRRNSSGCRDCGTFTSNQIKPSRNWKGNSETTRDCPGASHAHPTTNNTLVKMLQIARNRAPGPRCAPAKTRPRGKTLHIAGHRTHVLCQRCFRAFFGSYGVFWPLLLTKLDRTYTTWTDLVTRRPRDVFDASYRWINFGDDRVDCDELAAWGAGMTPTRNFEGWAFAVADRAGVLVAFSLFTA